MDRKWYYAADGKSIGPLSTAEVFQRIVSTKSESHLVWTEGMPDWAEAITRFEFIHAFDEESSPAPTAVEAPTKVTLAQRARIELIEFLGLSVYLFICFGALMAYKAAILRSVGVEFAPFGLAIVKALISAKFIMLLEALKLGERSKRTYYPLINILKTSSLFAIFLIILTVIEELIIGAIHGKEAREILSEIAGGTLPQALAVGLLLFLVMIPYFAYREFQPELMKAKN
jgi:hypothetical protein